MHTADSIEAGKSQRETQTTASNKKSSKRGAHLKPYQWKIGQSGNPAGRARKDYAQDFARMVLEAQGNQQALEQYAEGFAAQLRKGNAYTFKELAERGYGKLVQRNENTGKDGGPIIVEHKDMSRGDIDERIKQLEIELGYRDAIDETRGTSVTEAQSAVSGRTE